jgi:hypothetical protein
MVVPLAISGIGFGLLVAPMVDAILTDVPIPDAGSASGLLNTTQQVGMALGVALAGVIFFAQLADDSGYGADKATPSLQGQLTAAGIPPSEQDDIIAGFQDCVHDWSAATDPTKTPASCQTPPDQAWTPQANQLQELLTRAGDQANAHNFSRTFAITLWYGFGMLVLVFLGVFALPHQVRARDLDAELAAIEDQRVEAG